jgi:hypothetical protein
MDYSYFLGYSATRQNWVSGLATQQFYRPCYSSTYTPNSKAQFQYATVYLRGQSYAHISGTWRLIDDGYWSDRRRQGELFTFDMVGFSNFVHINGNTNDFFPTGVNTWRGPTTASFYEYFPNTDQIKWTYLVNGKYFWYARANRASSAPPSAPPPTCYAYDTMNGNCATYSYYTRYGDCADKDACMESVPITTTEALCQAQCDQMTSCVTMAIGVSDENGFLNVCVLYHDYCTDANNPLNPRWGLLFKRKRPYSC